MSPTDLDTLVPEWLSQDEVARRLGVSPGHVRQLLRSRELVAVRRAPGRQPEIPAGFVSGDHILKGLAGALTLLEDAGYDAGESIRWLMSADEALGGSPLDALAANRSKAVHRQAQVLGF